jgi:hypothetical protein
LVFAFALIVMVNVTPFQEGQAVLYQLFFIFTIVSVCVQETTSLGRFPNDDYRFFNPVLSI